MEGEGHGLSACQEHKGLLEYSGTFFPRSLEILQLGLCLQVPVLPAVVFHFIFPLFFFFFLPIADIIKAYKPTVYRRMQSMAFKQERDLKWLSPAGCP